MNGILTLWSQRVILVKKNTVMSVNITQPEEQVKVQTSVPAEIWRRARSKAALTGKTNGEMLIDALNLYLSEGEDAKS